MCIIEEDLRGLQWRFSTTVWRNRFAKFISLLITTVNIHEYKIRIRHACLSRNGIFITKVYQTSTCERKQQFTRRRRHQRTHLG